MRYYFISDVHLGYGPRAEDSAREGRLVRLLDEILAQAQNGTLGGVFIVGDLFDSWFEFSSVIPRRHVRSIAVTSSGRFSESDFLFLTEMARPQMTRVT